MPVAPFKVKAVFEYKSDEPDDLSFENGQIITIIDDEDADWYTGEYVNAAGEHLEGIFPRNFVEKYEPAIPSRPLKTPKRATQQELTSPVPEPVSSQQETSTVESTELSQQHEPNITNSVTSQPGPKESTSLPAQGEQLEQSASSNIATNSSAPKSSATKAPPPVAEKPTTNSFRDRIAAFNKPAAAPIAPFKPGGQAGSSSGFIKKPFIAPPPSKNSYVPPPREAPPQKIYRREEDPDLTREEDKETTEQTTTSADPSTEDQPKPTSLKERIALLQKQQLEQAARNAEKKDKPKRPPKKRIESSEEVEQAVAGTDLPSEQTEPNEKHLKKAGDVVNEEDEVDFEGEKQLPRHPSRHNTTNAVPLPARELASDTNDADDSGAADTEDVQENSTEEEHLPGEGSRQPSSRFQNETKAIPGAEGEGEEAAGTDEEEDEDPEIRRRREIRDRMAKMSGGMGMMGIFGGGGGLPGSGTSRKSKAVPDTNQATANQQERDENAAKAPPVPVMALPGMSNKLPKQVEEQAGSESEGDDTAQPTPQESTQDDHKVDDYVSSPVTGTSTERPIPTQSQEPTPSSPPSRATRTVPPPPPAGRAVPPPPPANPPSGRPVPPPPVPQSSDHLTKGIDQEDAEHPPIPTSYQPDQVSEDSDSSISAPPLPSSTAPSNPSKLDTTIPASPPPDRKSHRLPPLPPTTSPTVASPLTRPPPPPPPGLPPRRQSTAESQNSAASKDEVDHESDEEVTEYDGDYDTDIASSAKHKDALKSHNRDSSIDDGILTDDAAKSPVSPPARAVPPLPSQSLPREMPAPPAAPTTKSRKSTDAPRAAPPPLPPPRVPMMNDEEPETYGYSAPQHDAPPPPPRHLPMPVYPRVINPPQEEQEDDDLYNATNEKPQTVTAPTERAVPPPPLSASVSPPTGQLTEPSSYTPDARKTGINVRRSTEQSRPSGEYSFIATDIDLSPGSMWWTQGDMPPPAIQGRTDVLYEVESSSTTKRGGKTMISKEIYVLYMDYSQTTINATYDTADPTHANLAQNHQRPPPPPRKDQLENASENFGVQIQQAASNASGSTVGDGSARTFVLELLKSLKTALLPVGTRAYGALVYSNLANASTQQFDEIRPGDIVTFRNAKFSGHKGGLHTKYSTDVGKPEHVGVVIDWDGTKKKIRAWEQGREEKAKKPKIREESFKMGDLKSGEVRVWRVMPRSWVGWQNS